MGANRALHISHPEFGEHLGINGEFLGESLHCNSLHDTIWRDMESYLGLV